MVLTAVGVIAFIVALMISVVLHEAGHFLTARRYGMKATQFFAGFGPTLWSRHKGELEYGLKAIPAGGFVKIVGMTPLDEDGIDEPRAFWRKPARQRAVVLSAGSAVHFVLTIVLVLAAFLLVGKPVETTPKIGAVADCVAPGQGLGCEAPGAQPAPAKAAGLQVGDVVVEVQGQPVTDQRSLVTALRARGGQPTALTVERDGQRQQLTLTPTPLERPKIDGDGTEVVGTIGVSPRPRIVTERVGPVEAVKASGEQFLLILEGVKTVVTEKLGTITKLYEPDRDPEGFIGVIGAGRISGEVLASEETLGVKIFTFLALMASLNFFFGAFNLLPLLPLDGGHLAVLVYENARHRLRRLFGYRGELVRVDMMKLMPLTYAVVLVFIGLTLWIAGADIVNPIKLGAP